MIDINKYIPGRFSYLMKESFTKDIWNYLSCDERIIQMVTAIKKGKPAIEPFLSEIETKFKSYFSSEKYPDEEVCVLTNNMIKQILELYGFENIACGPCPHGKFFKTSGMFQKKK
jgi:hypothetical protein